MGTGKIYTFSIDLKLTNPASGSTGEPIQWAGVSLASNSQMQPTAAENIAALILRRNGAAQAIIINETVTPINVAEGTYANTQQLRMTVNTALFPWTAGLRIGEASIGACDPKCLCFAQRLFGQLY